MDLVTNTPKITQIYETKIMLQKPLMNIAATSEKNVKLNDHNIVLWYQNIRHTFKNDMHFGI